MTIQLDGIIDRYLFFIQLLHHQDLKHINRVLYPCLLCIDMTSHMLTQTPLPPHPPPLPHIPGSPLHGTPLIYGRQLPSLPGSPRPQTGQISCPVSTPLSADRSGSSTASDASLT